MGSPGTVGVGSPRNNAYLGDEQARPVLEELEARWLPGTSLLLRGTFRDQTQPSRQTVYPEQWEGEGVLSRRKCDNTGDNRSARLAG